MKKRERILAAAYELLVVFKNPELVTVREIAKQANVGVGLINYHFENKDALLMEAVGSAMAKIAGQWQFESQEVLSNPYESLRKSLLQLMDMGAEYLYLIQLAASFELTKGDIHTPRFILPYIMKITGFEEPQAKMIAFSMICNLQSATLRKEAFIQYVGLNLEVSEDRVKYLDLLLESHLLRKEL